MSWLADARRVPVATVAAELGLRVHLQSFGPCPGCGAESRANTGRTDKRGRCRIMPDGFGWACASNGTDGCGAAGDGPGLVAWATTGRKWTQGDRATADRVRDWFARNGWCEPAPGVDTFPAPRRVAPPPPPPQRDRPPADEVADLWARCVPVTQDAEVASWLELHKDGRIDPGRVADLDLARALPVDLPNLPSWARYQGTPWTQTGHRLVVRAYAAGPDGLQLASLHARNVTSSGDKAGWPAGASAAALVFAVPDAPPSRVLELVEGVPDWLRFSTAERGAPVWGVVAGSACPELAALVKAQAVAIRTHDDAAGNKYAEAWAELLRARGVAVHRAPPTTVLGDRLRELRQAPDAEVLAVLWDAMVRRYGGEALVPAPLRTAYVQRQGDLDA